jgi:hypothetical protein
MSKIRANSQIIAATIDRSLVDVSFETDLVLFTTNIASNLSSIGTLNTEKADITYVDQQINDLIAAAPGALDTLNELAAALGNDANFATTVTNSLSGHNDRITVLETDTDGITEADLVRGEVPTGVIDGVNLVFTMAQVPRNGSVMVYKNGVADFSPDLTVNEVGKTVTFAVAPTTNDKIHVCYEAVRA